jgi:hypothetical protein
MKHFHFWCVQSHHYQTRLFLKKSRTSRRLTVQSRSENALEQPTKSQ